ncbi:MAG: ABC transporter ATP-binding protein/permease [Clostridia bacterium]|nr:ABC transporter ATP-binding protein/permease [Clostridia bacterium]
MLRLTGITKEYPTGGETVVALRQVSLEFRKNEFVAILGPSGCGKTTLLNIIGGLDQYTDGDLSINGVSTKKYKDGDWDAYRNHSVGFVFQSYNLIPHQTVLSNVELALSISGVSKRERRARAVEALKKVGLGDQLKKKPNQMSGGQMQRVAIARALVNDPEILLADEPTGALDSETSVQVMELLKEIAKDRLVVMVTHNPELADQYATRIVRLLDGKVIDDSDPYRAEEKPAAVAKTTKKKKRPSMSFFTSLSLSLKNLLTKKGRTVLTAFAGSIGIIGISLIFAVSNGTKTYIDDVQEDTLSTYPLTLQATTVDLQTLMQTFMGVADTSEYNHGTDKVYSQAVLFEMINAWNNVETLQNDLKAFKAFLDRELAKDAETESSLRDALSGVQYSYDLDLQVYTKNVDGTVIRSDTAKILNEAFKEFFKVDMEAMMSLSSGMGGMSSMMTSMSEANQQKLWCEMLAGKDGSLVSPVIEGQYDLVYGSWPNDAHEVVLVLKENNELDDLTLYALGLVPKEEVDNIFHAVLNQGQLEVQQKSWTYEEICSQSYRVVLSSDCWQKGQLGNYVDLRETQEGMKILYNDYGIDLRVTGIIRPKEDVSATMLNGSIAYTKALTELVIARGNESALIKEQKENPKTDVFTGLPFNLKGTAGELTDAEKDAAFREFINEKDTAGKAAAFLSVKSIVPENYLEQMRQMALKDATRESMISSLVQGMSQQMGLSQEDVAAYLEGMSDEELKDYYLRLVDEMGKMQYSAAVRKAFTSLNKQNAVTVATVAVMGMQQLDPMAAGVYVAGLSDLELVDLYLNVALSPSAQLPEGAADAEFLASLMDQTLAAADEKACAKYYDEVIVFSESTYEENLKELGAVNLDDPFKINLFSATFEAKDTVKEAIAQYNESVDDLSQIRYTDMVGILMSSITTIIDAITYVLIAFVSISLVVSSIMIAVITLISVQERTKEIGILRAIGASKRNVSNMFNAETMIIGFASGVLGIAVTWLLCFVINFILHTLTGIPNLSARLSPEFVVIMIAISVLLTLISGLIPSRSAAKKDPVVALRTE